MEILYLPASDELEHPIRVLQLEDQYVVQQQINENWNPVEEPFYDQEYAVKAALSRLDGNEYQSTFELIEVEFVPIENGTGYWALMENEYHSRNPTPAESLLGCLLLLLRDRHGVYVPLNQEQRSLLGINLDNY